MGLIHSPGPGWGFEVDNLAATPAAANLGTSMPSGSSNADGTTTQLLSALAQDVHLVVVGVQGIGTTAEDNNALFDLMRDPAGGTSWASFIDDMIVGCTSAPTAGTVGISCWYAFPVFIKAGTALAGRCRKAGATATTARAVIYCFGKPKRPDMWWCGSGVESLGITAASSKGTAHTPGNSGAYSAYATIGTSTRRYGALQLGVCPDNATVTAIGYNFQIGVGSAQLPGTPTFYLSESTAEVAFRCGFGMPLFVDIAAATAIQVRATGSGTAIAHTAALYGVY